MTTFGLTEDGLRIPTQSEIREILNQALRDTFGASLNLGDKSILGQFNGILSEQLGTLWEKLEAINSSQNPDKATLAALDALCVLTGTFRPAASYSTVTLTLTGDPTTVVPFGSGASTASTEQAFITTESQTIVANDAWASTTAYVVGDRVTNGDNVYYCSDAGLSAGSGGPSFTSRDTLEEDDGTAKWIWLGEGTGSVDAIARATVTGPVTAVAYDISSIESSVLGWNGVVNLLDATEGRNEAKDGELRLRREAELATGGNSTVPALRAEILEVPDVTAATVFYNNTDVTDGDGIPPKAVEVLVRGGDDQDIFDALLEGVAAGIATHGTEEGTSTDEEGTEHIVKFSRPEEKLIYVAITLAYDEDEYPSDGDDQVKAAIVAFGDLQNTGKNVVSSQVAAQAFIAGVFDVSSCLISVHPTSTPVASTTIPISLRELAVFDTSRITVTSAAGVP